MKTKAIIFDFDGVLQDTFKVHRSGIKDHFGVDLSEDEFRDIHNGNFFGNSNESLKDADWSQYRDYIYHKMFDLKINEDVRKFLVN